MPMSPRSRRQMRRSGTAAGPPSRGLPWGDRAVSLLAAADLAWSQFEAAVLAEPGGGLVSADTLTCCQTAMPWPTRQQDQTCKDCGLVWEREPVDIGAGARIKDPQPE